MERFDMLRYISIVAVAFLLLTSPAWADGAHSLRSEATNFLQDVLAGNVVAAQGRVEPFDNVKKFVSVDRTTYERNVEAMIAEGQTPATLRDVVIGDVEYHAAGGVVFGQVLAVLVDSTGRTRSLTLHFYPGKYGWMFVGLE